MCGGNSALPPPRPTHTYVEVSSFLGAFVQLASTRQHLEHHDKVSRKAVKGVLEGRRLVLLEEEVSNPGVEVTKGQGEEDVVPGEGGGEDDDGEYAGDEGSKHVQRACHRVHMLPQIVRVEVREGLEPLGWVRLLLRWRRTLHCSRMLQ